MASRRPAPGRNPERPAPPVPDDEGPAATGVGARTGAAKKGYRTGEDYASPGEGDGDDRDLYGEDDPVPEELEGAQAARSEDDEESESTRAGPPRKLLVLAGPEKGKVKRLNGVRMVLGRATGCHIQLEDRSISRRHCELIQGERGVLLRDLVSGNGSKVNGETVEERLLKHEDVIEIGSSKLQFIDEVEAVKKAREDADRKAEEAKQAKQEAEKKKVEDEEKAKTDAEAAEAEAEKKDAEEKEAEQAALDALSPPQRAWFSMSSTQRMAVAAGGLVALLLLFFGMWALFRDTGPPPVDPKEALANKKMEAARVAMMDNRFEDAVNLIESAERIKPGADEDGLGDVARKEMAAVKSLALARSLLEQQRFDDARAELARTPEASAKRAEERDKLEQEINARATEFIEKSAQDALDALDPGAASQLIDQLPPERRKALEGRLAEVEQLVQKQEQMAVQEAKQGRERHKSQVIEERRHFIENAFRPVERKFHAQDFQRAVLECDRVQDAYRGDDGVRERARNLKKLIPTFERAWADGQKKVRLRAMESALRPLKKAKELYELIDLPGSLGDMLHEQLAEAEIASAKSAVIRGDLATAARLYKEAQRYFPGDDRAEEGLKRLAAKADELYTDAYMIRERDPKKSIETLKLVMQVAPKGSEAYEKAQAQLRLMEP